MSTILIISLSKKEEIIQQLTLMRGLREKNANGALHLLASKDCKDLEGLFEGIVDYIHYVDHQVLLTAFNSSANEQDLKNLAGGIVNDLKSIQFSKVYNFSVNSMGAYIAGMLPSSQVFGLNIQYGKILPLENRWLDYLKTYYESGAEAVLGYSEVISKAFQIKDAHIKSSDLMSRKRRVCLALWDNNFSDIQFIKQCKNLVSELVGVLGTYEVKVLVSPQYRELAMRYFKGSQILQGQIKEVKTCISESQLVICADKISEFVAAQSGTPVLLMNKKSQGASVFNDVMSTWNILSGEKQNQNNTIYESFEKNVWRLYLNKSSEHNLAIPSPTIAYDFGGTNFVSLAKLAKDKQEELHVQKSYVALLNAAFKNLANVSDKKVYKSDFKELALLAQSILKSKNDPSDYFRGFYLCFKNRYQSSAEGVAQLRAEVSKVEDILLVKQALIEKVETLSQKGSLYAKGFEFVSEKSTRNDREITGERSQESEIL